MSEPNEVKIELDGTITLHDLFTKSMEAWPGTFFRDVNIEYLHEQFKCFGYDQYDPSDWKDYIILRKVTK